ncbi:hypothetical protein HD806DRAFT_492348 [Xylariaceae sp. AK1471]|nr:hypothetical protein HD806DRAFT_492348 [Xylariaceae sp. AK1471]
MRAQVVYALSAFAASVAALPTASEALSRQTTAATWTGLSWSANFATIDWPTPYGPGPNGYIEWSGTWDIFANNGYVTGLPGFAATCSGSFADNNPLVGAWTLCHGSTGSSTVEGQLLGPDGGFQINVRQNVTVDGTTTVVTGSGEAPPYGSSDFTLSVGSVETDT